MRKDRIGAGAEIGGEMEKSVADKLFEGRKGKERRDTIGCTEEMWKRKRDGKK